MLALLTPQGGDVLSQMLKDKYLSIKVYKENFF